MNFNQFTLKSQETIQQAGDLARNNNHQQIEPAHLLMSLLTIEESIIPGMLKKMEVNVSALNEAINQLISTYPKVTGDSGGQYFSNYSYKALDTAIAEAAKMKDEFISMASHQLRTPLTSVKGYLSMVLVFGRCA